jgi:hypothetical protein
MLECSSHLFMPTKFSSQSQLAGHSTRLLHEERDVSAGWIFGIVLFLLIGGIVIHGVLAGMMERLNAKSPPAENLQAGTQRQLPRTYPRLQVSPPAELGAFRAQEERELNTYGWVNRTQGVVRLPLERAMELVLQRGLPVRKTGSAGEPGMSSIQLQEQHAATPPESEGVK